MSANNSDSATPLRSFTAARELAIEQLERDGWIITHDPYSPVLGADANRLNREPDRPFGAQRGSERIAVCYSRLTGDVSHKAMHAAIGQCALYNSWIRRNDPGRKMRLLQPANMSGHQDWIMATTSAIAEAGAELMVLPAFPTLTQTEPHNTR